MFTKYSEFQVFPQLHENFLVSHKEQHLHLENFQLPMGRIGYSFPIIKCFVALIQL